MIIELFKLRGKARKKTTRNLKFNSINRTDGEAQKNQITNKKIKKMFPFKTELNLSVF